MQIQFKGVEMKNKPVGYPKTNLPLYMRVPEINKKGQHEQ